MIAEEYPKQLSASCLLRTFLAVSIFGMFFFDYSGDVHWPPWSWLMFTIAIFITGGLIIADRIPVVTSLLFGAVLINGLIMFEWRPSTWAMEEMHKISLRTLAAHATAEFLMLSWLFYYHWKRIRTPIAKGLYFGGLAHAVMLIIDQTLPRLITMPEEVFQTHGLLGNRSIGATFTAVWMFWAMHWTLGDPNRSPAARSRRVIIIAATSVIAILLSVSSISYGALLAGALTSLLAYTIRENKLSKSTLLLATVPFLALGALGGFIDPQFFTHISRYDAWPMFYDYFKEQGTLMWGAGSGSFKWYGPTVQGLKHYNEGRWWLWAHNDWLQIIFEFGYITYALACLTYFSMLIDSFRRPLLFGAVVAYGVTMVGNYNLHIAATALLGFYIAFESWWGKRNI